jgi:hypothetical protein
MVERRYDNDVPLSSTEDATGHKADMVRSPTRWHKLAFARAVRLQAKIVRMNIRIEQGHIEVLPFTCAFSMQ